MLAAQGTPASHRMAYAEEATPQARGLAFPMPGCWGLRLGLGLGFSTKEGAGAGAGAG